MSSARKQFKNTCKNINLWNDNMKALRDQMDNGTPFHASICDVDLSPDEYNLALKLKHLFASYRMPTKHTKPTSLGTIESFLNSDADIRPKCIVSFMYLSGRRLADVLRWRHDEISIRPNGDMLVQPSDFTLTKNQLQALSKGKPASANRPFLMEKCDWDLNWPYANLEKFLKSPPTHESPRIFDMEIHQARKMIPFPPHGLRVTRTLILRCRGLSLADVADYMGWRDTSSVTIYSDHFAAQDIASASSLEDLLNNYPDTFV